VRLEIQGRFQKVVADEHFPGRFRIPPLSGLEKTPAALKGYDQYQRQKDHVFQRRGLLF
jgi:hypothetical protein